MTNVTLTVSNNIKISGQLPEQTEATIKNRLVVENPAYKSALDWGRDLYGIPKELIFFEYVDHDLCVPRGFGSGLASILNQHNVEFKVIDQTKKRIDVNYSFAGTPYDYQTTAIQAMIQKNIGVLQAPTGSGKTVIALNIIAHRGQRALIVVHNKELLYQWQERIFDFLGIPLESVGLIGDGNKFNKSLDIHVGIVNSVSKIIKEVNEHIGILVVDECHRVPSTTFANVASKVDCKFMLGLSATPYRRDKLTRLIWLYMGDKRHEISVEGLQESEHIIKPKLVVRHTAYEFDYFDNYIEMAGDIATNLDRNLLIIETVQQYMSTGQGMALVVSDRKQHCEGLYGGLKSLHLECRLMTGSTKNTLRKHIVEEINQGGVDVLVATTQLIGEGFDAKNISAVFLGMPIGYEGRLLQLIGRAVRTAEGKDGACIFDFVDINVGVLVASFRKRLGVYEKLGIKFEGSV